MNRINIFQKLRSKMGIKQLIVFGSLLPMLLACVMLTIYFNLVHTKSLYQSLHTKGISVTSKLSYLGEYIILKNKHDLIHEILKKNTDQEITNASLCDLKGNLIVTAVNTQNIKPYPCLLTKNKNIKELELADIMIHETKNSLIFSFPIYLKNNSNNYHNEFNEIKLNLQNLIGSAQVEISKIPTKIKTYKFLFNSIIITIFAIGLNILLLSKFGKKFTVPIIQLTKAVEKISIGKLNTKVNVNAKWELALLESGIRSMVLAFKKTRCKMQKNIKFVNMQLKLKNIELQFSKKKAEQVSKFKSKFLINISHELRTPLNSIIGFITLLQKTKLDEWQQEYFNTIKKSSINLVNIINNLLDFSKILYGKLKLSSEIMEIRECIDDALGEISFIANDQNLELNTVIENEIPIKIRSDYTRIKQIITTLVINFIKDTNVENVVVNVVLLSENCDNISICCNISNEIIDPLEIKKYCLSNKLTNNYKKYAKTKQYYTNVGIGFTICNKIINHMNGIFHIKPNFNCGYSFYFVFSALKIVAPNNNVSSDNILKLPLARLLLCDHNDITLQNINKMLLSWGLKVKKLSSVTNVINEITTKYNNHDPYDLLIIGVNYPISQELITKNFFDTIKKNLNCKIGVMVNSADYKIHEYFIDLGASICLAKPVAYKKTFNALCKILIPQISQFITNSNITDLSILVVDDNSLNLKLITVLLKNLNANVTPVNSGTEALNIISNKNFDMIFMDILMPDINGIQVANIIRKSNNPSSNAIIIALSAHMLLSEQELFKTAGINDYLIKPITENQLKNIIYKWIQYNNIKEIQNFNNQLAIESIPNLDWKLSLKLASGKSKLAKDLFEMMINSLPKEKKLINAAYNKENLSMLREQIHKLHGGCCYTGFSRLKYICKKLEQEIILKNHNKIQEYLQLINQEINFLITNYYKVNRDVIKL